MNNKFLRTVVTVAVAYAIGKAHGITAVIDKYGKHIPDEMVIVPLFGKVVTLSKSINKEN